MAHLCSQVPKLLSEWMERVHLRNWRRDWLRTAGRRGRTVQPRLPAIRIQGYSAITGRCDAAKSMWTLTLHLYVTDEPVVPKPPALTCSFAVRGYSATKAHLVQLPADGSGAHVGPGGGLKLGGESFYRGQTVLQRYFLQNLAVLLFELVRSAAPGQRRRYSSAFPLQDDSAHSGPRQVQQGGNFTDWLFTHVASDDSTALEVTELLTTTHCTAISHLLLLLSSFRLFSSSMVFASLNAAGSITAPHRIKYALQLPVLLHTAN